MKSFLLVLAVLIGFFNPTVSTAAEEKKSVTWTYNMSINSNYLAFGAGIKLWNDECVQGSITATFSETVLGENFYITLWGSSDLEGKPGSSLGDEIDLGIGATLKLGGDWTLDWAATYFDEPHLGKIGRFGEEDIFYAKLKLSHPLGRGWNGWVVWESYTTLFDTTYNGGTLGAVGVGKTFDFDHFTVPFSVEAVYDDGGFGFAQGWLLRSSLEADFKLNKNTTLAIGGRGYLPFMKDDREPDVMAFVAVTFVH